MSWNERIGLEWLKRIVALLFALADHAEQLSHRSYRVRRRVLAILRVGEASAFRTVGGVARQLGAPLPPHVMAAIRNWKFDYDGDDPDNALHLAYRFRALAIALAWLVQLAEALDSGTQIGRLDIPSSGARTASSDRLGSLTANTLAAALRAPIRAPPF